MGIGGKRHTLRDEDGVGYGTFGCGALPAPAWHATPMGPDYGERKGTETC
jgi:hypothetical protein